MCAVILDQTGSGSRQLDLASLRRVHTDASFLFPPLSMTNDRHTVSSINHTFCFAMGNKFSQQVAFGDNLFTSFCDGAPMREKAVAVVSYLETGPNGGLAQAEMIKLFSLFYNQEAKGNAIFYEIEVRRSKVHALPRAAEFPEGIAHLEGKLWLLQPPTA